jgi:cytochrome c-type biogenesis protein CcmE
MRSGRKKWPFAAGIVVIIATVSWLAYSGIQESKTYYVTVSELSTNQDLQDRRLRVAGDVTTGSILRESGRVNFKIEQGGKMLQVVYTGTEPLPDTLQDGAEAIADGRYQPDGTFHAEAVQAKCPSKYEAKGIERQAAAAKPGEYRPPATTSTSEMMKDKYEAGYASDYSGGYSKSSNGN